MFKGVELRVPFETAVSETWERMISLRDKTGSHKFANVLSSLIQQCALAIFTERKEDATLLLNDILKMVEEETGKGIKNSTNFCFLVGQTTGGDPYKFGNLAAYNAKQLAAYKATHPSIWLRQ